MAGKRGRSGRRGNITEEEFLAGKRPGSPSWPKHPTALAGNHLKVLIEMWLAGAPIRIGPDHCLMPPTERRYTVPPKIMRTLAIFAIRHVLNVHADSDEVWDIDVEDVLAWARRRAPDYTLRRKARQIQEISF
jgi:hypothetical protein